MSIPRVRTAVGPDGGLPAHPAPMPDATAAGSNVTDVPAVDGSWVVLPLRPATTLVQVLARQDALMLCVPADTDPEDVADLSPFWTLMPGYHSFAVPAGRALAFSTVAAAVGVAVTVLEG